jgi:fructokinase
MAEIVTVGELLIDFIAEPAGLAVAEAQRFVPAAGGAPANVAVGAARLGAGAAFLGKVGDDPFGRKLATLLASEGVDVSGLRFDASARTALAFVALHEGGEREFSFYRHPSADMLYRADEVDLGLVRSAKILHFGSISMIHEPARAATLAAVEAARAAGVTVSFDPNLRPALWPDADAARAGLLLGWERAQVIKASEEELEFLAGDAGRAAARRLMHPGLELLTVTRGARGVDYLTPDREGSVPGFAVEPRDTTGAGDAFVAALLESLARNPDLARRPDELRAALRRANACAALTVTRHGAIPALPSRAELDGFLAVHRAPSERDDSSPAGRP